MESRTDPSPPGPARARRRVSARRVCEDETAGVDGVVDRFGENLAGDVCDGSRLLSIASGTSREHSCTFAAAVRAFSWAMASERTRGANIDVGHDLAARGILCRDGAFLRATPWDQLRVLRSRGATRPENPDSRRLASCTIDCCDDRCVSKP